MKAERDAESERVWCVSSGEYSDYRVLCACPTKKDAKAVVDKIKADSEGWRHDARVEELPLVTADVEQVDILMVTTTLWDDGTETDQGERVRTEWPFDSLLGDAIPVVWRWVRAPCHVSKGGRLDVSGTDHERVRKVFSDKRAQLIADDVTRRKQEWQGRMTARLIDGSGVIK